MKKRILSLALALGCLCALAVPASAAYSDGAHITHLTAVTALTELGVVQGKDDGSFDPAAPVTRAEAAQILYNTLKAVPMEKKPLSRTGETVTYTYQKAARADGTPVTLLELLFRRTELPTQAK